MVHMKVTSPSTAPCSPTLEQVHAVHASVTTAPPKKCTKKAAAKPKAKCSATARPAAAALKKKKVAAQKSKAQVLSFINLLIKYYLSSILLYAHHFWHLFIHSR